MDGYYACVCFEAVVAPSFACRLSASLGRIQLGRVTGITKGVMTLSLASDSPAALAEVARSLVALGAPAGTWVGSAECPRMIEVAQLDCASSIVPEEVFRGSVSAGRHGALALYPQAEARLCAVLARAAERLH